MRGALIVGEAGYTPKNSKIAVGAWYYTEKSDDLVSLNAAGNPKKINNQGAYIIGEHQLYNEQNNDEQGLTGFIRLGFADKNVNQFDYAYSAGLVYTGLIPSRNDGKLGLGISSVHNSNKSKQSALSTGTSLDSTEKAFELTYADNITPWLSVQPDVQYIINPGTDKTLDNALVIATRLMVSF